MSLPDPSQPSHSSAPLRPTRVPLPLTHARIFRHVLAAPGCEDELLALVNALLELPAGRRFVDLEVRDRHLALSDQAASVTTLSLHAWDATATSSRLRLQLLHAPPGRGRLALSWTLADGAASLPGGSGLCTWQLGLLQLDHLEHCLSPRQRWLHLLCHSTRYASAGTLPFALAREHGIRQVVLRLQRAQLAPPDVVAAGQARRGHPAEEPAA